MKDFAAMVGEITQDFVLECVTYDIEYYRSELAVSRLSGTVDRIPILISKRNLNRFGIEKGNTVKVEGILRSYRVSGIRKKHTKLMLLIKTVEFCEEIDCANNNYVCLEGVICQPGNYHKTPMGRDLTDTLLRVDLAHGKFAKIPCLFWEQYALDAAQFSVGTRVMVEGRLQSRKYDKKYDNVKLIRTTHEVSVYNLEVRG